MALCDEGVPAGIAKLMLAVTVALSPEAIVADDGWPKVTVFSLAGMMMVRELDAVQSAGAEAPELILIVRFSSTSGVLSLLIVMEKFCVFCPSGRVTVAGKVISSEPFEPSGMEIVKGYPPLGPSAVLVMPMLIVSPSLSVMGVVSVNVIAPSLGSMVKVWGFLPSDQPSGSVVAVSVTVTSSASSALLSSMTVSDIV